MRRLVNVLDEPAMCAATLRELQSQVTALRGDLVHMALERYPTEHDAQCLLQMVRECRRFVACGQPEEQAR